MNNIVIATETDCCENRTLVCSCPETGVRLEFSPATDARIEEVIDGKVLTQTEQDAEYLAGEMRCFGIESARAFGHAVVFWG